METKTKDNNQTDKKESTSKNRCPDYDNECIYVPNHLTCFMGGKMITSCCNKEVNFEIAEGYCPFIHGDN